MSSMRNPRPRGKLLSFPMDLHRMQQAQSSGGDPWKQRVRATEPPDELLSFCDAQGWGWRVTCVEVAQLTPQAMSELTQSLAADVVSHYSYILNPRRYERPPACAFDPSHACPCMCD